MSRPRSFDAQGFYAALDAERISRGLTWKKVASEAGVSASTLTRMAQGKRPDVDSLAKLCGWAGLDAGTFMTGREVKEDSEPLTMISTYLRSDPNLSEESATALDELIKATYARLRKA